MERHATLPYLEGVQGILQVVRRVVEDYIADAAAQNDSEDRPDHEVIEVSGVGAHGVAHSKAETIAPTQKDSHDVGQSVPAYRKWSDLACDRVDIRNGITDIHKVLSL